MAEITAARITNLHERIKLILGNGAGQNGYGQSVESSPVSNQSGVIDADDINSIYRDMINARAHQIGTNSTEIAEIIEDQNVIAEDTSFIVDDTGATVPDPDGTLKGILDYENLMSSIEADKFLIDLPTQAVLESGISDSISSPWNGVLTQDVVVTFESEDNRRHFFNTGGQIRISANLSNTVTLKGEDWQNMLANMGTVTFAYNSTTTNGDGTIIGNEVGPTIGNYQLTTTFQGIFEKTGSGIYSANSYRISARYDGLNPQSIVFRIQFSDDSAVNLVDNNVDGTLQSVVQQIRAESINVSVPSPSYFNQSTLA